MRCDVEEVRREFLDYYETDPSGLYSPEHETQYGSNPPCVDEFTEYPEDNVPGWSARFVCLS